MGVHIALQSPVFISFGNVLEKLSFPPSTVGKISVLPYYEFFPVDLLLLVIKDTSLLVTRCVEVFPHAK